MPDRDRLTVQYEDGRRLTFEGVLEKEKGKDNITNCVLKNTVLICPVSSFIEKGSHIYLDRDQAVIKALPDSYIVLGITEKDLQVGEEIVIQVALDMIPGIVEKIIKEG